MLILKQNILTLFSITNNKKKQNEATSAYFPSNQLRRLENKLSKKFALATLTYIDKFSLILLPGSGLQQPYKVHFHLVELHIDVASLTRSIAGSQTEGVKLVHGCTNV